jgi:hypothetical protein
MLEQIISRFEKTLKIGNFLLKEEINLINLELINNLD